jgi:protein-disulfide isomerase
VKTSLSEENVSLRLWLLSALALSGIIASIILTQHFYDVRSGAAGFKSFCNIGEAMNCDAVSASGYAELFFGIPLASVAAGWYLALLIVSLAARNVFWRREAVRAAFGLTALALVMSLFYFFVMAAVLKTFCLFCLVLDGINIVAFVLVLTLKPEGFSKHPPDRAKWKFLSGATAVSLLAMVLGLKLFDAGSVDARTIDELVDSVMTSAPVAVNAGEELPSIGHKDAPITIVEFSDFQCPFCRTAALTLNSVVNRFPGKVRVVFRNYPLDPSCNRLVKHSMHRYACLAAKTVVCAQKHGFFEPVYEALFDKQDNVSAGKVTELAVSAGMNREKLDTCVESEEAGSYVSRDIEEGERLGIKSTPTLFINGRKVTGAYPLQAWSKIIEQLLEQK